MRSKKILQRVFFAGISFHLFVGIAHATAIGNVTNWDVDGANGALYVHGVLTESACRLEMSSAYQTVEIGGIDTGRLSQVGQLGTPVAVELRLEDCLMKESASRDQRNNQLWSPQMPAMKIRFLAPADEQNPNLVGVFGVKGLGLQISDAHHTPIIPGEYSIPMSVSPGKNQLTYYVTPIRTPTALNAGAYYALIRFQLNYD